MLSLACSLLFACSSDRNNSIPSIYITYDSSNINFGAFTHVSIKYYDTIASNNDSLFDNNAKIKFRGNKSAQYAKKNFSVKLSEQYPFTFASSHKNWKLNAEYIDKTFLRNKLSYDLFRSFSPSNFAPRIQYVKLYNNEEYHGLYTITDRIDKERLKLHPTEGLLFKAPPIAFKASINKTKKQQWIEWLINAERYENYTTDAKVSLIAEAWYNQRYPDIRLSDKSYVIDTLSNFIFHSPDSLFTDSISFSKHFDINNIVDWQILLMITNNSDGIIKNFWLYQKDHNSPFLFAPWDYDHSFSRDGNGESHTSQYLNCNRMRLLGRLMSTNAFNYHERKYKRFLELKDNSILTVENLHKMIDSNVVLIDSLGCENEIIWPVDAIHHFKNTDFIREVDRMKKWIEKRLPMIEKWLKKDYLASIQK